MILQPLRVVATSLVAVMLAAVVAAAAGPNVGAGSSPPAPTPPDPQTSSAAPTEAAVRDAIDRLGSFDFDVRTDASRVVRRAAPDMATTLLADAARSHKDQYVRYRALVLLAGFGDRAAAPLMREALVDRNDRLRTVAGNWFEHAPDPDVVPALVAALAGEQSEFVRPALTRAVAAHGTDPRARAAITPLVMQGQDFFRGAAIEALGDYQGVYAAAAIDEVSGLDGPLQDDAILALAKMNAPGAGSRIGRLQQTVSRDLQPAVSAGLCLLGQDCAARKAFIRESLGFAIATEGQQPMLRSAAHALSVLAVRGHDDALRALFEAGTGAGVSDAAQAPIALGVGLVALRNPGVVLAALGASADPKPAMELLRDAFDMLSEDFEEERFFVFVRRAYWAAPEGSAERRTAEALIAFLEF